MFSSEIFEKHLATSWLGHSFHFFEELPSTNTFAKEMEVSHSLHGTLILAEDQTGGRGQYERRWIAEAGQNLTFSLILEPQKSQRFTLLTLSCALAISEAVQELTGLTTKLKWPNDILCKNKKLCGILTETQFSGDKVERVVIGVGLNVNQPAFEKDLSEKATSMSLESSEIYSREKLLAQILQKIEYRYRLWNQFSSELVKDINERLAEYGNWTKLRIDDEILEGEYKFLGVNEAGAMVVLNQDLDVKTFEYEQVRLV